MVSYPDFVARFYDVIYDSMRSGIDHDFYLGLCRNSPGPVLEVGTGTGRLLKDALEAGVDIHGLDVSDNMLDILRQCLAPKEGHRITRADIRSFKFDRRFDLIVAPFRVFSHLLTITDQLQALNNVAGHLTENGLFVFDLFVPDPVLCSQGMPATVDFDGFWKDDYRLRRISSSNPDYLNQINHVTMRYEWVDDDGAHAESWLFDMRYFFRYELDSLIARSSLRLEAMQGDFRGSELQAGSKDFVVFCRRKS